MPKKFVISVLNLILVISITVSSFPIHAHADALTIDLISGLSYMVAQSSGLDFAFDSASSLGVDNAMSTAINHWIGDSTISEKFGTDMVRTLAGKIVVPATLYNGIRNFLNYLIEDNDLVSGDAIIFPGEVDGIVINNLNTIFEQTSTGFSVTARSAPGWIDFNVYYDGVRKGGYYWSGSGPYDYTNPIGWTINGINSDGRAQIVFTYVAKYRGQEERYYTHEVTSDMTPAVLSDRATGSISRGYAPTVLNPQQEWVGDFGGTPDTNLDQLLDEVFQDVADNNLVVEGEVIDPPQPTPTPMPIDPGTPLQNVPWEGLDNNLNNLYEQGLEEIGKIGEAQNAITGKIDHQTGVVEDLINGSTGVVSGAISQAASDIQSSIGAQTEALAESLSTTAAGVETIAEALEDESINWPKFNLRGLFPFCIPFDIYHALEALDASPSAPHVQLPFVIPSIGFSYTIDLDFSQFDQVASVMRQMELLVYGIALAWATSKVIKW